MLSKMFPRYPKCSPAPPVVPAGFLRSEQNKEGRGKWGRQWLWDFANKCCLLSLNLDLSLGIIMGNIMQIQELFPPYWCECYGPTCRCTRCSTDTDTDPSVITMRKRSKSQLEVWSCSADKWSILALDYTSSLGKGLYKGALQRSCMHVSV